MTIAYFQDELIGPRVYAPEGPFGSGGFTSSGFKFGEVISGDGESEFTYLMFNATAGQTLNQGDAVCWDNSYIAVLTGSAATALAYPVMTNVGTFFCGGRVGDPAAAPAAGSIWSATFPTAGMYGIWVQRSGTSLLKTGTITSQATAGTTNSVNAPMLGGIGFVAAGTHANPVQNIASCLTSAVFTATTVIGSAVLSAVSSFQFLAKGQTLSGAGIPAGSIVTDLNNGSVTMSKAATAAAAGVSITAANGSMYATVDGTTAVLTNVSTIAGFYPNQVVTGTGIAAGSVIKKIEGNNAPYKVTLSLATTAAGAMVNVTVAAPTNAAPNYLEAFLRWPTLSGATT